MAGEEHTVTVPADLKLGFVGAGKMAQAIIKGILKSGLVPPKQIMGSALSDATKNKIKEIGIRVGANNEEVARFCHILIMGVKPHQICGVLQTFPFLTSSTLVVSIAAGVTCACIAESLPAGVRVGRVMPNLPVELGAGTCGLAPGPNATPGDMALLEKLLKPCGYVEHMPESYIDVTSSVLASMYSLPVGVRVTRVMPNLPVEVGAGTCALSAGPNATSGDMALLEKFLSPCGFVEHIPEAYMDVTSSVTHSMYGSVIIEALSDGCVKMGLPRALSLRLCAQSLLGAAKLCLETGKHPAVIKDEVCSPGGTTIAALHHLEKNQLRSALIGAIETQTLRAQELGRMAAEAEAKAKVKN